MDLACACAARQDDIACAVDPRFGMNGARAFLSCGRHHRSSHPALFILMCAARPVSQSLARRLGACTSIVPLPSFHM